MKTSVSISPWYRVEANYKLFQEMEWFNFSSFDLGRMLSSSRWWYMRFEENRRGF